MSEEVKDTAPVVDTAPETTPTEAPAETQAPSFRDSFKEKVGEDAFKSFEKYTDDDSLVNGIKAAQSMIGKKGDIPAEDAAEDAYQEFWGKLGSDKIDLKAPELGEEFGDLAGDLKETYGGITARIQEIAKEQIGKSKNLPDIIQNVLGQYLAEDAEATRLGMV